ncbi:MAG: DUF2252 family protein [Deltaproteobacteria bacterium]|nr:DUF2252 family protein [Deltaproteobacteria bacterium]
MFRAAHSLGLILVAMSFTAPASAREAQKLAELRQRLRADNAELIARDPARARAKLERMAESAYTYFRGFNADVQRAFADRDVALPRLVLNGDVHPMNFGPVRLRTGQLVFAPNDHDEAAFAPFAWDLRHGALGFELAGRELGFGKKVRAAAVQAFLAGYLATLEAYPVRAAAPLPSLEQPLPAVLRRFFADASARTPANVAARFLDGATGQFRASEKVTPRPELKAALAAPLRAYLRTLPPAAATELGRYELVDVAQKLTSGVGSLGLGRYLLALAPRAGRRGAPIVLELKEERRSAVALVAEPQGEAFAHHGERVLSARRRVLDGGERFDGATTYAGAGYLVTEVGPHECDLDWTTLRKSEVPEVARACGAALAASHARSQTLRPHRERSVAAQLLEALPAPQAFVEALARDAVVDADRTAKDYRRFLRLYRDGTLLPEAPGR